jgi:hypothetical protein
MNFNINNRTYTLNTLWETISLRQAMKIVELEISEEDLNYLLTTDDISIPERLLDYVIQVLTILSNVPLKVWDKVNPLYLIVLFQLIKKIIYGLHYLNLETYTPQGIKEIRFKGKTYKMPESLLINDEEIVCYKEPSKNIIEASNLVQMMGELETKGISLMHLVCAIYLKEDPNELYDEEQIAHRSELFKDLPMSIVFEVFFFTYFYLINYLIGLRISLENPKTIKKFLKKNSTPGYSQLLNKEWLELYKK